MAARYGRGVTGPRTGVPAEGAAGSATRISTAVSWTRGLAVARRSGFRPHGLAARHGLERPARPARARAGVGPGGDGRLNSKQVCLEFLHHLRAAPSPGGPDRSARSRTMTPTSWRAAAL